MKTTNNIEDTEEIEILDVENGRSKKKNKTMIISSVLVVLTGILVFVVTASYSFFTTKVTSKNYVVYTGSLKVDFENSNNLINLNNTYPMTNIEGLATTPYTFNIKNNGTIKAKYQVRIDVSDESNIPIENIKISYSKNNSSYSEPVLLSDIGNSLAFISNQVLNANGTDTYGLKLWLDINSSNDIQGKTFKASIIVDAIQDIEEGYEVDDSKPIIVLNKYSDGNIDQIINVGSTYQELGVLEVKDDKDKISANSVTINGSVNTSVVGVYDITYSVTDSDGNTTTAVRTIAVGNEESLNIKHSLPEVLALFTSAEQQANEAVVCGRIDGNDTMYLGCELKDTLDNAIASKNKSGIILTKNITVPATKTVAASKDIILDLNGHNLDSAYKDGTDSTYNSTHDVIYCSGKLIINDSVGTGELTSSYSGVIIKTTAANANLIVNAGKFIGRAPILNSNTGTSVTINGGEFIGTTGIPTIENTSTNGVITINNAKITTATGKTICNSSSGTVTINGGNIEGTTNNTIYNAATGTIIINGQQATFDENDNYVSGTYIHGDYNDVLYNYGGNVIINDGTFKADKESSQTTTSNTTVKNVNNGTITINNGLFDGGHGIRNEGTGTITINGGIIKTYGNSPSWYTCVCQENYNGIININNGSFDCKGHGIRNEGSGTININSASIKTYDVAAFKNNSVGVINICRTNLINNNTFINNSNSGFIYYSPNAFGSVTPTFTGSVSSNIQEVNNLTCN